MALLATVATPTLSQASAAVASFRSAPDGLIVNMGKGVLKLQPYAAGIVRVSYALGENGSTPRSLSVIATPAANLPWTTRADARAVWLETDELRVRVDRRSGAVAFQDRAGHWLLTEADGPDARSLGPRGDETRGAPAAMQSRQAFRLGRDEAFYGLGQHQNGVMSYRGNTVRLRQENRESAIPVLVSTKGYGVLWDNPAVTRVNVGAEDPVIVPAASLFTVDARPGGLTAQYFAGEDFGRRIAERTDAAIDFDWSGAPPVHELPHDHYSVRWAGYLRAPRSGRHELFVTADDGVRLWLDDRLLVDEWSSRPAETFRVSVQLVANHRHRLRVEYYQNVGGAVARLAWRPPSTTPLPVVWTSEAATSIDYFFLHGPQLGRVVAHVRRLTGSAPMLPRWAWGLWQSKERYQSQQELLDVARWYRERGVPLDVLFVKSAQASFAGDG